MDELNQPIETAEQKYERMYGTNTAQPVVTDTNTAQAPPPVVQQVVATLPPELTQTIQSLRQELSELKSRPTEAELQRRQAEEAAAKVAWTKKIQEGDYAGAQQVIVDNAKAALRDELKRELQTEIQAARQGAYQDALTAGEVQREMDKFTSEMRVQNPDLVQFERYLQAPVAERMQLAQQAGRVQTPAQFLSEYKEAVKQEVTNLRNLGLQFRAAGKEEALTRSREVLTSQPLNPQRLNIQDPGKTSQTEQQGESTEDYFARRRADEARRRGLV